MNNNNKKRNMQNMYDECNRLMNYHVIFTMRDGRVFDGIIQSVDPESVMILVGEDVINQGMENTNQDMGNANQGMGSTNQGMGSTNQGMGNTNQGMGNTNQGMSNTNQGMGNTNEQRQFDGPRRFRRFRRRAFPLATIIALSLLPYPYYPMPYPYYPYNPY